MFYLSCLPECIGNRSLAMAAVVARGALLRHSADPQASICSAGSGSVSRLCSACATPTRSVNRAAAAAGCVWFWSRGSGSFWLTAHAGFDYIAEQAALARVAPKRASRLSICVTQRSCGVPRRDAMARSPSRAGRCSA